MAKTSKVEANEEEVVEGTEEEPSTVGKQSDGGIVEEVTTSSAAPTTTYGIISDRTFEDVTNCLYKKIPSRFIQTRPQGKVNLKYISWNYAVKLMDFYAKGWSSEIIRCQMVDGYVFVTTKVTLKCADITVEREATGAESIDSKSFADPFSMAEAMSLKRAFAKFGLGLYLYEGDDD